jgi:hypothetical protein
MATLGNTIYNTYKENGKKEIIYEYWITTCNNGIQNSNRTSMNVRQQNDSMTPELSRSMTNVRVEICGR